MPPARSSEDPRLLRGTGTFVDDVDPPGVLHAAMLRSPYGHARFSAVNTAAARAYSGVHAVYTAADLGGLNQPAPLLVPDPNLMHRRTQRPLAEGKVCYIGEAVAMVVAEDRYIAEDAVGLIEVDWEPLRAVVDFRIAAQAGQPLVHANVPNNVAARLEQQVGDIQSAFDAATHVFEERLDLERACASPIETRGVLAIWDAARETLTVWDPTQAPQTLKNALASLLGVPESKLDVIAPDVGGGFGTQMPLCFPEEVLVPWAALQLGRAVKWSEDRREHFIVANHEPGQLHRARVAVDGDGHILGVESAFLHDSGAYSPYGVRVASNTVAQLPGPYRVANYRSECRVVYTNMPCISPYRGAGRPQACFVMERLIDRIARELQLDANEVRRRNFVEPAYAAALERAEAMIDVTAFRREQHRARAEERYLGLGFAPEHVTSAAGTSQHAAVVEVSPLTGDVRFLRYVVVHHCDVGNDPSFFEAQIHGGVAQGIGGALFERLFFDDSGQLLTASFMDFVMPTAMEIPDLELAQLEPVLDPTEEKGPGEAGTLPVAALVAEAVEDALAPFNVRVREMPLSPARILELIEEGRQRA